MTNKTANIGLFTLCGLIIGPIIGSGIVLLPAVIYERIGDWAILGWTLTMLLGAVFAYVFIFLSLKSPGNEGVALAVGKALGPFWQELCSNFLTTAVCFGPVAVLLTAAKFLQNLPFFATIPQDLITFFLILGGAALLLSGTKSFSRFNLIVTAATIISLVFASFYSIATSSQLELPHTAFPTNDFGYALLLLFWAIVGWEVVGNYIEDIKNPRQTLLKAMTISLFFIIVSYLSVALALQSSSEGHDIVILMQPLFGHFAAPAIGIIAAGLCISTYLMIVGAVTRMSAKRAANGRLPAFLSKENSFLSPSHAILTLTTIHLFMLSLIVLQILTVDRLIAAANVFFLSNAIIGLAAGFQLLENRCLKAAIAILILAFFLLLFNAKPWCILLFLLVFIYSKKSFNQTKDTDENPIREHSL